MAIGSKTTDSSGKYLAEVESANRIGLMTSKLTFMVAAYTVQNIVDLDGYGSIAF
jgi:hypothetical protein